MQQNNSSYFSSSSSDHHHPLRRHHDQSHCLKNYLATSSSSSSSSSSPSNPLRVRLFRFFGRGDDFHGHLECGVTSGTDGRKGAEDGETNGTDESNVDEIPMAETRRAIIHVLRRWERQFRTEGRTRQEHPHQILKWEKDK